MKERTRIDLKALATDEKAIRELAADIEQGKDERPSRLWTEEFSASGEKQGGGL